MDLNNAPSRSQQADEQLSNSSGGKYRLRELVKQVTKCVNTPDPDFLDSLLGIPGVIGAVHSTHSLHRLCAALRHHVDAATSTEDKAPLLNAWKLVTPLLKAFPHEPRLGFSAERLIVSMQKLAPLGAAEMILEGLSFGWMPRPMTIVCTLTKAQSRARSYEDLRLVTDLSVNALEAGALDLQDASTGKRLNVYLACTTDPKPSHQRISDDYAAERTIADVARRTELGLQVADALVKAGVAFSSETMSGRIDYSIRGIASVAAALGLECAVAAQRISAGELESARKRLGLGFDWSAPEFEVADQLLELKKLSESLLIGAVEIAGRCLSEQVGSDRGTQRTLTYHIDGRTVSHLLLAVESIDLARDEDGYVAVADLLLHCLQVPAVSKDVSWTAVRAALEWMSGEGIDQELQGQAILMVLPEALPRITDAELLGGRLTDRLLEYLEADPAMEKTIMPHLYAMGARFDELTAQHEHGHKPIASRKGRNGRPQHNLAVGAEARSTWFSDLVGWHDRSPQ